MKFILKIFILAGLIVVAKLEKDKTLDVAVNSLETINQTSKNTASNTNSDSEANIYQKISVTFKY